MGYIGIHRFIYTYIYTYIYLIALVQLSDQPIVSLYDSLGERLYERLCEHDANIHLNNTLLGVQGAQPACRLVFAMRGILVKPVAGGEGVYEFYQYIYIYMAPRWHQGTIALRALKKNKKTKMGKMPKSKS